MPKGKFLHRLCTVHDIEAPVIGIDFDGVLAKQIPWEGPCVFGEPLEHAAKAVFHLRSLGYKIAVFTARGPDSYDAIREWCAKYKIEIDFINENPLVPEYFVTNSVKPLYDLYIDDKAVRFNGSWPDVIRDINRIKYPYWMKERR